MPPRGPYDGYRNAALLAGLDLRGLRRGAGIKVKTVGAAIGTAPQNVSNWERGTHRPSGEPGAAYARFILGLARHAAVEA